MSSFAIKATGLGVALLLSGHASAFELGQASGHAILGQPLRLEIPLSGTDGQVPANACFRLRQPQADIGNDFVARNGRVEVLNDRGRTRLAVTSLVAVREPVIGFIVVADCAGLAKEYTMLVALPAPATPAVEPVRVEAAAPAHRVATPAAPSGDTFRVEAEVTLKALAREKYPSQPRARERFTRMMLRANPDLEDRNVPIAAGTDLRMPPGLPERRMGPYRAPVDAAPPEMAPRAEPVFERPRQPAAASAPPPRTARKGNDRLVLGTVPESKESVLLAEAERLTNVLLEQNKVQEEMITNIATLEANYKELREQFAAMQSQLARAEAERAEAKRAADYSRFSKSMDLLIAVLGGGALGGIMLRLLERRRVGATTLDPEIKAV